MPSRVNRRYRPAPVFKTLPIERQDATRHFPGLGIVMKMPNARRVGGGEKGYQFGGREGARCGVTLWPAVGAEIGKKLTASSLRRDCLRF